MSDLFTRASGKSRRKKKAFQNFEKQCFKEKSLNLNPLLAIIINLVPMFLIVLNMRAIVGFKQTNMPEANFNEASAKASKETFNVDVELFKTQTRVFVRDHKGSVVQSKKFSNIKKSKSEIAEFLLNSDKNLDHLSILTPGKVHFDEIGQAIDLSKMKKKASKDNLFTNFSIGNIL
jgi:biopolymer transport protein ExbD